MSVAGRRLSVSNVVVAGCTWRLAGPVSDWSEVSVMGFVVVLSRREGADGRRCRRGVV